MRFLSEKVEKLAEKLQNRAGLLVTGVSLFATMAATAQIDPGLTYEDDHFEINDQIYERAKEQAPQLVLLAKNLYSEQLNLIETKQNNYLQSKGAPDAHRVRFVDQATWDVMKALDREDDAVELSLQSGDVAPNETIRDQAKSAIGVSEKTLFRNDVYTTHPTEHSERFSTKSSAHILIPASPYGNTHIALEIPGLSKAATLEYINRHEAAHGGDTHNNFNEFVNDSTWINENFSIENMFRDEMSAKVGHNIYKLEVYADLFALGEMIADGHSPDILDHIAAWRRSHTDDIHHMSANVLLKLKQKIEEMDDFRTMGQETREQLYIGMLELYGLEQSDFVMMAQDCEDHEISPKLLAFKEQFNMASHSHAEPEENAAPAENRHDKTNKVYDAISDWEPKDELIEAAYQYGGKVTAETITLAYGLLQNELMEQAEADPDQDYIYREKMSVMQNTYIYALDEIDYAQENQLRDVPVTELQKPINSSAFLHIIESARHTKIAENLMSREAREEMRDDIEELKEELAAKAEAESLVSIKKSQPLKFKR